jgi:hypothetical protein
MRKTIREQEPVRPSTKLATLQGDELTTTAKRRSVESAKLAKLLRGDLDWIVMKCLEKDRQRRYDTANGLAMDIKRHLNNDTVVARPPTVGYRFQKSFRRNKLAFTAATAVAVALLIGLAASVWQAIRATHAEREQKKLREVAVKALGGEKAQRTQAETERQRAETNAEKFKNASIQSRRSQYAADLFAATAEIEKGKYGAARNFLREYFPGEGKEELRGFEWRYLWQLSAGQQLSIYPIGGQVIDMAWSPNGEMMAAGSSDRTIKLLRAATGEVINTFTNNTDMNVSVAFSHDGNGLATAGFLSPVRFWDVRDGRLLFTLTNFMSARVACSPAGPLMAVGTGGDWWGQYGSDVYLVDIQSGKQIRALPKAGDRAVFIEQGGELFVIQRPPPGLLLPEFRPVIGRSELHRRLDSKTLHVALVQLSGERSKQIVKFIGCHSSPRSSRRKLPCLGFRSVDSLPARIKLNVRHAVFRRTDARPLPTAEGRIGSSAGGNPELVVDLALHQAFVGEGLRAQQAEGPGDLLPPLVDPSRLHASRYARLTTHHHESDLGEFISLMFAYYSSARVYL